MSVCTFIVVGCLVKKVQKNHNWCAHVSCRLMLWQFSAQKVEIIGCQKPPENDSISRDHGLCGD